MLPWNLSKNWLLLFILFEHELQAVLWAADHHQQQVIPVSPSALPVLLPEKGVFAGCKRSPALGPSTMKFKIIGPLLKHRHKI